MTRDLFGNPAPLYETGAELSEDLKYRFSLTRIWDRALPRCCWIMLNPSYADAHKDDPTIRKCVTYAKTWGYGSIVVVNVSPYRSTDPKALRTLSADEFIGPLGGHPVLTACRESALVVCGWGRNFAVEKSVAFHKWLLASGIVPHVLDFTKDGHPMHPLYLRADLRPVPWR